MRPPTYVVCSPTAINERLTEVIHLISANDKKLSKNLSKEEIEAIEILLKLCKYFRACLKNHTG